MKSTLTRKSVRLVSFFLIVTLMFIFFNAMAQVMVVQLVSISG